MSFVAVTQRVDISVPHGERRDALDQRWAAFLSVCGVTPVLVPNDAASAERLVRGVAVAGVLLTGGNSLAAYGGNAPERDATEFRLLGIAAERGWPVVGVCRGMQVIQHHAGVALGALDGHVACDHAVDLAGVRDVVNSYHELGAHDSAPGLDVLARAEDGVVEAVADRSRRLFGMMWHPERFTDPRPADVARLRAWWGIV